MKRMLLGFFFFFGLAFALAILSLLLGWHELVSVSLFTVGILASVVWMIVCAVKLRGGNSKLLNRRDARRGVATIREVRKLPMMISLGEATYPPQLFRLELEIELPGEAAYRCQHHHTALPWHTDHLRPGTRVPCLVHPRRKNQVHLLFDDEGGRASDAPPVSGNRATPRGAGALQGMADRVASSPGFESASEQALKLTGLDLGELLRQAEENAVQSSPGQWTANLGTTITVGSATDRPARITGRGLVQGVRALSRGQWELDLLVSAEGISPYRFLLTTQSALAREPRLGESLALTLDPTDPASVELLG